MDLAQIIESIRYYDRKFAREAVEAAIERRDEVTPALLSILEEEAERGADLPRATDYIAPMYAMFLLAQFRERRAYPLMTRIGLLTEDNLETLFGDFITGHFGSVLASVCDGDLTPIKKIIESDSAFEWARVAAIHSLTTLVNEGQKSREEILDYYAFLFKGGLSRTRSNEVIWSFLVGESMDLYPQKLLPEIERAYGDGLVDETIMGLDDVHHEMLMGEQGALAQLARDPHHRFIQDTVKEFGRWACFQPKEERRRDADADGVVALPDWYPKPDQGTAMPCRRVEPKIGRNDPCPCGSGKKYKKCCG